MFVQAVVSKLSLGNKLCAKSIKENRINIIQCIKWKYQIGRPDMFLCLYVIVTCTSCLSDLVLR